MTDETTQREAMEKRARDMASRIVREFRLDGWLAKELEIADFIFRQMYDCATEAVAAERERAAGLLEDAIGKGYATPANKTDQCEHGKFGWEDCIACYDNALLATAQAIRGGPNAA